MNHDNLIKMSNQIGAFFEAMPDRDQAIRDVEAHILNVCEPRMRAALLQHVARVGDAELKSIVRDSFAATEKFNIKYPTNNCQTGREVNNHAH